MLMDITSAGRLSLRTVLSELDQVSDTLGFG